MTASSSLPSSSSSSSSSSSPSTSELNYYRSSILWLFIVPAIGGKYFYFYCTVACMAIRLMLQHDNTCLYQPLLTQLTHLLTNLPLCNFTNLSKRHNQSDFEMLTTHTHTYYVYVQVFYLDMILVQHPMLFPIQLQLQ